jgi:4-hydroxybutyrate CoA-transferase
VPLSPDHRLHRTNRPLHEAEPPKISEVEARIGEIIAGLVDDGATLQMGIGAIPDAVLAASGRQARARHPHRDVLGRAHAAGRGRRHHQPLQEGHPPRAHRLELRLGHAALFDFVDDNLAVEFHPCDRTNDTTLIRQNPKVCAINSALEIDLTGQVCADSIGHRIYSGIGGQMDFIRGASLSPGGKPIIALPSTAAGGRISRIVPELLKEGAGVVTTRGHVHWVVTEHGAVEPARPQPAPARPRP